MVHMFFAAEKAAGSPLAALGVDFKSFLFQIITFVLVLLVFRRVAFKPISKMLAERRTVIDDGVRMGLRMEQEKSKLDEQVAKTMRDARHEADQIVAEAHKEARLVIREAEKAAGRKADNMLADAEARINEEAAQAQRKAEKDLIGLVSEATEAIIGEKVDAKKDAELVSRAMKGRKK